MGGAEPDTGSDFDRYNQGKWGTPHTQVAWIVTLYFESRVTPIHFCRLPKDIRG